jgi:hypothetical protein
VHFLEPIVQLLGEIVLGFVSPGKKKKSESGLPLEPLRKLNSGAPKSEVNGAQKNDAPSPVADTTQKNA